MASSARWFLLALLVVAAVAAREASADHDHCKVLVDASGCSKDSCESLCKTLDIAQDSHCDHVRGCYCVKACST